MPRDNRPGVTGDLTGSADGSRLTGLYGPRVPGASMARGTGKPGPQPTITLTPLGGTTVVAGGSLNFQAVLTNPAALPLTGTPQNFIGSATFSPTTVGFSLGDLNKVFSATWAAAGAASIRVVAPGGILSNAVAVTVTSPSATGQQLSGSTTGTTGSPTTLTVALNGPAPVGGGTTTITAAGATLSSSTLTWTFGGATSQTFTIQRATDGSTTVSITNSMGLSNGPALTYTSSAASSTGSPSPFTLTSATSGTLPFTVGHAFRDGDIPSGQSVVISGATARAAVLNRYPSGAVKFAVIGGTYSSAGSAVSVGMSAGSVSAGASLTAAALQSAMGGNTAVISAATAGAATWSGSDWASPFATDCATDLFARFTFRKPFPSDSHLVAWLEVTLFAGGAVEVLPYVENGFLLVASPTLKTDTFSFTLGGATKFAATSISFPHHTRSPLISGPALSYWLGTDPGVTPQHDKTYLQATELVPTFFAATSSLSVGYPVAATTYTPLQQGDYKFSSSQVDAMTATGYGEPIGLIPGWDAKYLTATSAVNAAAYGAVIRNAYSMGRYPIHYRDETASGAAQHRPIRFSSYPTLALYSSGGGDTSGFKDQGNGATRTPAITDTTGTKTWDTAHCPGAGYLAYLLTGRRYFMEECQFAATINFLGSDIGTTQRKGSQGVHQPDYGARQLRSAAWGIRTLSMALCVTPDADVLQTEFKFSMQSNIDHYHGRFVAQANNPLGYIFDWNQVSGVAYGDPWQHDFFTGVVGFSLCMKLPLDAGYQTKWAGFMGYTSKSVIGRLGDNGTTDAWWINAFQYQIPIGPVGVPDWAGGTGPWYANHRAAYDAWVATSPTVISSTEGFINLEFPNVNDGPRGFLANALPAISYAVRHGVSGALAAYNRLITASNFWSYISGFESYPLWAQRPSTGTQPTWAQSSVLNEWLPISGTSGAGGALANAYSGWAIAPDGKIVIAAAGGHGTGSFDNRITSLSLFDSAPSWTVRVATSTAHRSNVNGYEADGKPQGRHTYSSTIYMPTLRRVMLLGCRFDLEQNTWNSVDAVDPFATTWQWSGVVPGSPGTSGSGYADVSPSGAYPSALDGSGAAWWFNQNNGAAAKYTPGTNTWSSPTITGAVSPNVRYPWAWDSRRGQFFGLAFADGEGFGSAVRAVRMIGTTQSAITINASAAYTQFQADAPQYAGMDYDRENDRFLFYSTNGPQRVYVITPNSGATWDMSLLTLGSGTALLPTAATPMVNKWTYVPLLRGFVAMPDSTQNLYFLRTAA